MLIVKNLEDKPSAHVDKDILVMLSKGQTNVYLLILEIDLYKWHFTFSLYFKNNFLLLLNNDSSFLDATEIHVLTIRVVQMLTVNLEMTPLCVLVHQVCENFDDI